jgi:SagB-type dehydrogenase family enzyme
MLEHDTVIAYHERTKHDYGRLATSTPWLDWATQPDPFRRYPGAPLFRLPLTGDARAVPYWKLFVTDRIRPLLLDLDSLALFFRYALSLTAWKRAGGPAWSLRANPSSGNLHPTEGYAVLPPLVGLHDRPAVYHYVPKEHGLEQRCVIDDAAWAELVAAYPGLLFAVGLSSVQWRESWRYGERGFRYCEQDAGHAFAAMRLGAAALGWRVTLLDVADRDTQRFLGLDRDSDYDGAEREQPELMALVTPTRMPAVAQAEPVLPRSLLDAPRDAWSGNANVLGPAHREWPIVDDVTRATRRGDERLVSEDFRRFPSEKQLHRTLVRGGALTAAAVILGRRSAIQMDGATTISAPTFFRMMARLVPTRDGRAVPWDAVRWRPRVHVALFVHRVAGLRPGLYVLVRDPETVPRLRAALRPEFRWERPAGCPAGLDLYLLVERDLRALAALVSCAENMAADGAFGVAMIADYLAGLAAHGPAFYRNLHWEAGMIGQVLYLEAEEAGVRSTGLGCYFDDPVHEILGITNRDWQDVYHFAVGGPVEAKGWMTLPAYGPLTAEQKEPRLEAQAIARWENEGGPVGLPRAEHRREERSR